MPLVSRTFDQLIDFTRTTAGTFVGSNGLIQNTPASRNLLTWTQEFDNAAWTKTAAQVVPNQNPAAATLGAELVTNGDFSAGATGWTLGTGWSIGSGVASRTNVGSSAGLAATTAITTTPGRVYAVTYTLTVVSGNFNSAFPAPGPVRTASGTYTDYYTVSLATTTLAFFGGAAFEGTIDNISVREVIGGFNTAPDGTLTADTLLATARTHCPQANQVVATVNATAYTASWFVRAGTATFVQLAINGQTADWCNFTLTGNGSVQNNGAAVGAISFNSATGYYRVSMAYTAGGTDRRPIFAIVPSGTATRLQTATYVGTESVIIWGAQLELGSLTDYTRNVGGVFPPRFDFDPVTRAPRGLLIEEQRTNLLLRSEEFDDASWQKFGTGTGIAPVVTANAVTAPDGTLTADQIVFNKGAGTTSGDQSAIAQGVTIAVANVHSIWLRADTPVTLSVRNPRNNGTYLTADVTTTWQRFTFTDPNAPAALSSFDFGLRAGVGVSVPNTATVYAWGAQLEAGAFATSYIPTVASQVTRTADQASITGPNFSQWYNQSEGTFVVEASTLADNLALPVVSATDGSVNNRIQLSANAANSLTVVVGGSVQAVLNVGDIGVDGSRLAGAVKQNDFAASRNGGAVATDTSGTVPTVDRVGFGNIPGLGGNVLNGHIRRITYYPTRLSNAQLQALTA